MITLANSAPVHRVSKIQQALVSSTTEAEYTAASSSSRNLCCLGRLTWELHITLSNEIHTDNNSTQTPIFTLLVYNKGSVDISNRHGPTKGTRHMDVRTMLIQKQVRSGTPSIQKFRADKQLADFMTKSLVPLKLRAPLSHRTSTHRPAGRVVVFKTTTNGALRHGSPQIT